MIPAKVKKFLEKTKIKYEILEHKTVYTAVDKSSTLHVPAKQVGKTLVVKLDSKLGIVLIPADRNLDKNKLKKVAKAKKIDFVSERVIKNKLKGVKVGAVPPLGSLWKLPTFVDRALMNNPKIIINAGLPTLSLRLTPSAYRALLPDLIIGSFSKKK